MRIIVEDIAFGYSSESLVLTDLSFEIPPCSSTAIIGPSGSGKTTLLAILGGLLSAVHGEVAVSPAERWHQQAWVLQSGNLLGARSVIDNVCVGALSTGQAYRTAKHTATDLIELVGLAGYEHRRARTLSGGQAQRMCIARALASEPFLILADEPTGNLDRANSLEIGNLLLREARQRSTVVVATHDREVAECADYRIELG